MTGEDGNPELLIGVDVGGTFTDVVVQDGRGGEFLHRKVSTTPEDPAKGILRAVEAMLAERSGASCRFLHGTTITTNALIQHTGARVGLLLTEGLRGILQVQSGSLGDYESGAGARSERPAALVAEEDTFEIAERVDRYGDVLVPLEEEPVRRAARIMRQEGIRSVGVCFLFAFMNPAHEHRARALVLEEHPDCTVLCSADLLPRVREWPRCSTLLLSAYLEPVLAGYIDRLSGGLAALGIPAQAQFIMESNGGVMPFRAVTSGGRSVHTLLSGPAAAVVAAHRLERTGGRGDLLTMDIGGTSCDVAFVSGGVPAESTAGQVCGYEVYVPMFDITTVGAGGGTIARVDPDGRLVVGPDSAGSWPGPASYGRGGTCATVTDADVLLGYLSADVLLGGSEVVVDDRAAREVVDVAISGPLGMDVEEAAMAITRINNAHMADAIRVVAARKGIDLSSSTIVACGGAGPVHAACVGEELGVTDVLVPPSPGVFSALGLLASDVVHDYVHSALCPVGELSDEELATGFWRLEEQARRDLCEEGFGTASVMLHREVDARYGGQGFEIRVPVSDPSRAGAVAAIEREFHDVHCCHYGHAAVGEPVVLVSYRLRAIVATSKPAASRATARHDGVLAPVGTRPMRFATGEAKGDVFRRVDVCEGDEIGGPAIVVQDDTTVLVPPAWTAKADAFGNLLLHWQP